MAFQLEVSPDFERDYRNWCDKNAVLTQAVDAKVRQICEVLESNPDHFKSLHGQLAGLRRVHIAGSFVLIFDVLKAKKAVRLLKLAHHDEAYR